MHILEIFSRRRHLSSQIGFARGDNNYVGCEMISGGHNIIIIVISADELKLDSRRSETLMSSYLKWVEWISWIHQKQQEAEAVGKISILAGRHFYYVPLPYSHLSSAHLLWLFVANCLKSKFCCSLLMTRKRTEKLQLLRRIKLRDKQRIA